MDGVSPLKLPLQSPLVSPLLVSPQLSSNGFSSGAASLPPPAPRRFSGLVHQSRSSFLIWVGYRGGVARMEGAADGSHQRAAKLGSHPRRPLHLVPCHLRLPEPCYPPVISSSLLFLSQISHLYPFPSQKTEPSLQGRGELQHFRLYCPRAWPPRAPPVPVSPSQAFFFRLCPLELYRNNFQGKIPAELGNLRSLISMDLYGNQLQGEIPKSFAKLKSLRFFCTSYGFVCRGYFRIEIYQGFRHQNVIPCCLCGISVLTTTADSMDLSCKDWSRTISAVESYVSTGVGAYRPRVLPDTLQDGYSTKVTESWNTYNLLCYV
ncbi:hypothetical protein GW17_00024657 [Ensete ventricosum]|nr:hypothetical protein GW17_00024657 [Ensete ventricosum]